MSTAPTASEGNALEGADEHEQKVRTSAAPVTEESSFPGRRPYCTMLATLLGLLGVSWPVPVCVRSMHHHVSTLQARPLP